MNLVKDSQGREKIVLYTHESDGEGGYFSRTVEVVLEPERFTIFACTAGEIVKKHYGDFDLEEWIFIDRKHGPALIELCCALADAHPPRGDYSDYMVLDMLHGIYAGNEDAFGELRALLKDQKFPHEFQFYA